MLEWSRLLYDTMLVKSVRPGCRNLRNIGSFNTMQWAKSMHKYDKCSTCACRNYYILSWLPFLNRAKWAIQIFLNITSLKSQRYCFWTFGVKRHLNMSQTLILFILTFNLFKRLLKREACEINTTGHYFHWRLTAFAGSNNLGTNIE